MKSVLLTAAYGLICILIHAEACLGMWILTLFQCITTLFWCLKWDNNESELRVSVLISEHDEAQPSLRLHECKSAHINNGDNLHVSTS